MSVNVSSFHLMELIFIHHLSHHQLRWLGAGFGKKGLLYYQRRQIIRVAECVFDYIQNLQ